jgi:hypothetical protein
MVSLSTPRLLRQIDASRVDPDILARCRESRHWLRRGHIYRALDLAQTAVRLAARLQSVDKRAMTDEALRRTSTGIALLFLAYVRHLSNDPFERSRALLTGQIALTWLTRDDYHYALAALVLANIAVEEERYEAASAKYQAALPRLDRLIAMQRRKSDQLTAGRYAHLRQSAQQAMRRVPLAEQPATPALPPQPGDSAERDWLAHIQLPAELIWTNIDLAGLQLMAVQSAERNVAILSEHVTVLPDKLDYIEINQLSIAGHSYQILAPPPAQGRFRMQTSQPYYAFQFAAAPEQAPPGRPQFVLVRPRDRALPPEWPIVILIPAEQRALLVRSQPPASPLIIGDRVWSIQDGAEAKTYSEDDVQIAGAAVALLTPLVSSSTE